MNSSHRTDSDEGELEDVLLEVKPIKKLHSKLSQMHSKIKESNEVKQAQTEASNSLDKAFDGLKALMD